MLTVVYPTDLVHPDCCLSIPSCLLQFLRACRASERQIFPCRPSSLPRQISLACAAGLLRVPDVEALAAFQLNLHKVQAVQGDLVGHYVVDDAHGNTRPCRYSG